jgi:hypothetical protein
MTASLEVLNSCYEYVLAKRSDEELKQKLGNITPQLVDQEVLKRLEARAIDDELIRRGEEKFVKSQAVWPYANTLN